MVEHIFCSIKKKIIFPKTKDFQTSCDHFLIYYMHKYYTSCFQSHLPQGLLDRMFKAQLSHCALIKLEGTEFRCYRKHPNNQSWNAYHLATPMRPANTSPHETNPFSTPTSYKRIETVIKRKK